MRDIRGWFVLALGLGAFAPARPAHAADACLDSLDAAGRVRYEYEGAATRKDNGGMTYFHFDQHNHYTYTFRTSAHGDSVDVIIVPHAAIEITPWHLMHLPGGIAESAGWYRRLVHHEHDHVAISMDGRAVLLAQWLVSPLPPLQARAAAGTTVQGAFADRVIGDAIGPRYMAVSRLIQANYDLLDSLTRHGLVALPDREAFFAGLYDRAALERVHFPYLLEAEPVLLTDRYVNAPRPRCDGSN